MGVAVRMAVLRLLAENLDDSRRNQTLVGAGGG